MTAIEERPLRADARRNRAAILVAARAVFAQRGRDAQMDDVARRAELGVGTLYRHFPDKEALLAALARERFQQLAELAQDALQIADPWTAFETYLRSCAELQASDLALSQVLNESPQQMCDAACERGDLMAAMDEIVGAAQADGSLRPDARPEDIPMIICSLARTTGPPGASWQRMLALTLDGLRAHGSPLPG